jgi:hypothetical protein
MAYSFGASSTAFVDFSGITDFPYTMAGWGEHNSITNDACIVNHTAHAQVERNSGVFFRGDIASDPITGRRQRSSGVGSNTPTTAPAGYSANTPVHVVLVCNAATDARLYVDGVEYLSATSVLFPASTPTRFTMGMYYSNNTAFSRMSGRGQSWGLWNVALTADEARSLAKGFAVRRVRPQSLLVCVTGMREYNASLVGTRPSVQLSSVTQVPHLRSFGI